MSRAKYAPKRLPLFTKLVAWLRRLPVRVRAVLGGGGTEPASTGESPDNSARVTALAEPFPEAAVLAAELSETCERDALSTGGESIRATDDPPSSGADVPRPPPDDVPAPVTEPSDCEQETPSAKPVSPEELLDESPRATDDPSHDSEDLPEPASDVPAPAAELSEACEREAPSASEESLIPEELPNESHPVMGDPPDDGADHPEPPADVQASAPEPNEACERNALSTSEAPDISEELLDEPLHLTDDLPHDSGDLPELPPEVPAPTAELNEEPPPSQGASLAQSHLREEREEGADQSRLDSDSIISGASEELATAEELLDESLHVANDLPHDSGDLPEPASDVPTPAAELSEACEREALSGSKEPVISGELLDETLHHPTDDLPHDSEDLPEPRPDVTTPTAETGEASQRKALNASDEPVTPEKQDESRHVTKDLPHDSEDLPDLPPDIPAPAVELSEASGQEALSASEEPATPEQMPEESLHVTNDLPHDGGDVPELPPEVPAPAVELRDASGQEALSASEPAPPEQMPEEPHDGGSLPEPPLDAPAPVAELSEACVREALIRRRWMETGIKMWNPRIHGTGDVTLSIQGRVELLAPAPGETLPRYDKLEFKVFDGQIVCEGITVER